MRKIFKSIMLLALTAFAVNASAETAIFDFSTNPNKWGKPICADFASTKEEKNAFGSVTEGDVTITTEKNAATAYPAIRMMESEEVAYYLAFASKHSITISVPEGKVIEKVNFQLQGAQSVLRLDFKTGTLSLTDDDSKGLYKSYLWTATDKVNSITSTLSGSLTVKSITVTYSSGEGSSGGGTGNGGDGGNGGNGGNGGDVNPQIKDLDDGVVLDLSKRMLVSHEQWGDPMGEVSRAVCVGKKNTYYDKNLNIASIVNNKIEMESLNFVVTNYSYYNYDEKGQLNSIDAYQVGTYDFGEMSARPSAADNVTYTYNDKGQRTSMHTAADGDVFYTYNQAGQLVTETRNTGKTNQKRLIYTYNEDGTIASVEQNVSDEYAFNAPTECYKEVYTYSKAGRLVMVNRVVSRDVEYKYYQIGNNIVTKTMLEGTPLSRETWKYVEGYLAEKYKYQYDNSGNEIPASRIIYKYEDDKKLVVSHIEEIYNASKKVWTEQAQLLRDIYKDYSTIDAAQYASEIVSVTQSTDANDGMNTALVEFTLPPYIYTDSALDIIVYRDGLALQTITPSFWDTNPEFNLTYDEQSGHIIYKDHNLKTGHHEYFLQTLPTVGGAIGGGEGGAVQHEESHIVSNVGRVNISANLPRAINLRVASTSSTQNGVRVTVAFDYEAPILDEYGFKRSILVKSGSLFYDDANSTTNAATKSLSDEYDNGATVSLQVVTMYDLGTVQSDPLTVEVSTTTAIDETFSAEDVIATFDLQGRPVGEDYKGTVIRLVNGKAKKVMK